MPAILANANKFSSNSDHPHDKVIYMTSDSFLAEVTFSGDYSIAHGLTFEPLPILQWSLTSDFKVCYEIASNGTVGWESYGLNVSCIVYSGHIHLSYYNNTGGAKMIYYRIIGLMPSNINLTAAETAALADKFVDNSDLNYLKLYKADILTLPQYPAVGADVAYDHNLGYIPRVFCWDDIGTPIAPIITPSGIAVLYDSVNGEANGMRVTSTQLIAVHGNGYYQAAYVHYRVYLDE